MFPVFLLLVGAALTQNPPPQLRIHRLHSIVFDNERSIRVLLPAGYEDPANAERQYPVLYLNDGQNLFDSATSIFGPTEWKVDETVAELVENGKIPAMIVVGVDNIPAERDHEYLPWIADPAAPPPDRAPMGRRYPDFLIGEVMPLIARHYRIETGPENTGLGGSSYGSLIALYTVLARPGVFGKVLLESTSLWVDNREALRMAADSKEWPGRVYIGVGTNENGRPGCTTDPVFDPSMVNDATRLDSIAVAHQPPPTVRLVVEPCAMHNNTAWARRLPEALTFLFGR